MSLGVRVPEYSCGDAETVGELTYVSSAIVELQNELVKKVRTTKAERGRSMRA